MNIKHQILEQTFKDVDLSKFPSMWFIKTLEAMEMYEEHLKSGKSKQKPNSNPIKTFNEAQEFIEKFIEIKGGKFRLTPKVAVSYKARIKEGYSLAMIIEATKNCFADDYHKANPKYLTPEFILRPDKLEKYLNAKSKKTLGDNRTLSAEEYAQGWNN